MGQGRDGRTASIRAISGFMAGDETCGWRFEVSLALGLGGGGLLLGSPVGVHVGSTIGVEISGVATVMGALLLVAAFWRQADGEIGGGG